MTYRWYLIPTLVMSLGLSLISFGDVLAEEGIIGDLRQLKQNDLAGPSKHVRRLLSGRSWLITSGMDPAMGIGLDSKLTNPVGGEALTTVQPQAGGGGAALVPFRDPSAKFSRNILIPEDFGPRTLQTEPALAVNPKDPDHLLVGMIDYNFTDMVSYTSIDGGTTWKGPHHAKYPRSDLAVAGDPIVAFGRNGTAYYGFLSLDVQEFTVGSILSQAVISSISINSAVDGGSNWKNPVHAVSSGVTTKPLPPTTDLRTRGLVETSFLDKPWMAIGPNPKDLAKDVIYITYTRFIDVSEIFWLDELPFLSQRELKTVIEMVKSEDGGLTWSNPIEVSPLAKYKILLNPITEDQPTQASSARRVVQGPTISTANDGTLYIGWLDTTNDDTFEGLAEIYVRRSDDSGKSFQAAKRVSAFLEPGFQARNASFRSWSSAFPKLATGMDNDVYLTWVAIPNDDPEDDGDVFMVSSINKGDSWSRRKKINDDDTDHFQFFPEITVDPNGTLHAMWGDLRDDPNEVSYHIYYASSENQGKTWSTNSRVTDFPSNPNLAFPNGRFIGDYFGLKATKEDVYMVWADSRLGELGPINQKIGFARKRMMPAPSIFISPPSGPSGKDIIIQGFNFQARRDVFIEVAGVIVSSTRTQSEGRFSTQIFMPISGEGAHTVRAFDSSGNVANSSYFMDFGFDSIEKIPAALSELREAIKSLEPRAALQSNSQVSQPKLNGVENSTDKRLQPPNMFLLVLFGTIGLLLISGGIIAAFAHKKTGSPL